MQRLTFSGHVAAQRPRPRRLRVPRRERRRLVQPVPADLRPRPRRRSTTSANDTPETAQDDHAALRDRRPRREAPRPRLVRLHRQEGRRLQHRGAQRPPRRADATCTSLLRNADDEAGHRTSRPDNPERPDARSSSRAATTRRRYRFTAPADGKYLLLVGSRAGRHAGRPAPPLPRAHHAGAAGLPPGGHARRRHAGPTRPPCSRAAARRSPSSPVRQDGFTGDIALTRRRACRRASPARRRSLGGGARGRPRSSCSAAAGAAAVDRRDQGQGHGDDQAARRWCARPGRAASSGRCQPQQNIADRQPARPRPVAGRARQGAVHS